MPIEKKFQAGQIPPLKDGVVIQSAYDEPNLAERYAPPNVFAEKEISTLARYAGSLISKDGVPMSAEDLKAEAEAGAGAENDSNVVFASAYAVGDGVTDDTAGLQAAINALESDPDKNILDLGSKTYKCATLTTETTPYNSVRFLKLGGGDLTGRDIIIRGNGGKILFAAGSAQFTGLWAIAKFRSLTVEHGVTIEKDSTPSIPTAAEPNFRCLLLISAFDYRVVEHVTIGGQFINGHQSVVALGRGRKYRGKLKCYNFLPTVRILNPYGSNLQAGITPVGGGQQIGGSAWVDVENYNGGYFNGGWDGDYPAAENPIGRVKDGAMFSSARLLNVTGGTYRQHGIESLYHLNTYLTTGQVVATATVPAVGANVSLTITDKIDTDYTVGEQIYVQKIGVFEVVSATPTTLVAKNINATPAASIPSGRIIYENQNSPAKFTINGAEVVMTPSAGDTYPEAGLRGIVSQTRLLATGNRVSGGMFGIEVLDSDSGAFHPPGLTGTGKSIASNNSIEIHDTTSETEYSYGIYLNSANAIIEGNSITAPFGRKAAGIVTRKSAVITNNVAMITGPVASNGYSSSNRSVGIATWGNDSNATKGTIISNNQTGNWDVGVGTIQTSSPDVANVVNHQDLTSVVPVDGLLANFALQLGAINYFAHNASAAIPVPDWGDGGSPARLKLNFSAVIKNTGGWFNSGDFTIPITGLYRFSGRLKWTDDVSDATRLRLFLRTTTLVDYKLEVIDSLAVTQDPTLEGEAIVYFGAGTVVSLYVEQNCPGAAYKNLSGSPTETWAFAELIG